jgi:hypothetical protein
MTSQLVSMLLLPVLTISCGSNPAAPSEIDSTAGLISALRQRGLSVPIGGSLPRQSTRYFSRNAHVLVVDAGALNVFEYESYSSVERDASRVAADGYTIGTTSISWIGPPHFSKNERVIVVYLGSNLSFLLDRSSHSLQSYRGRR